MKNVLAIVAVLMLTVAMGRAQTAAPASIGSGLIVSSSALDIYYKGSASAGNLTRTQFDFLGLGAKKTNHIFVEANQLFAPTPGLSLYTFGAGVQPDLTKVFAKTNVNPASFSTEGRSIRIASSCRATSRSTSDKCCRRSVTSRSAAVSST